VRRRFAGASSEPLLSGFSFICVFLTFSVIISVRSSLVLDLWSRWLSSGFRSLIWEFDAVSSERRRVSETDIYLGFFVNIFSFVAMHGWD
jgi:hypothetical protein